MGTNRKDKRMNDISTNMVYDQVRWKNRILFPLSLSYEIQLFNMNYPRYTQIDNQTGSICIYSQLLVKDGLIRKLITFKVQKHQTNMTSKIRRLTILQVHLLLRCLKAQFKLTVFRSQTSCVSLQKKK